ncbi:MAG: hypothetical protein ABII82_17020 [Verrucomicrobiota bacterium]
MVLLTMVGLVVGLAWACTRPNRGWVRIVLVSLTIVMIGAGCARLGMTFGRMVAETHFYNGPRRSLSALFDELKTSIVSNDRQVAEARVDLLIDRWNRADFFKTPEGQNSISWTDILSDWDRLKEEGKQRSMVFANNDLEQIGPLTLHLPDEAMIVYVETNGRKISALDAATGNVLWSCDPYIDWNMRPYRFSKPIITSLKLSKRPGWLDVRYNSSQFGVLETKTGQGYMGGND